MLTAALAAMALLNPDSLVLEGKVGPGKGKHVVLIAGDEEYRSEEMLPQLAKILAERHGFTCTVLFPLNEKGEIDPNSQGRQSSLEPLKTADLCIIMLRFRQWEDAQMKRFVDYYLSGKPIIALRTSTHAFAYPVDSASAYRRYGWQSKEWRGGFGKQVVGENWVSHWGAHGTQATRGHGVSKHPVLRGVEGVFGPTDVYEAGAPADAEVLMRGEVVAGMKPTDPPAEGRKKTAAGVEQGLNDPMMPIVWVREPMNEAGVKNRIMACTMGAATDFESGGFRRLLVNGVFWATGLEVPDTANVDLVGKFDPSPFGFDGFRKGLKPQDYGKLE